MLDAEMRGFQNLDESAMNQLGSFRFSLQVAALELSESWSYFIEQERQVSHASALTHDAVLSQKFNRALSVRREGVKQPHATAKQNCAPKAPLQSSASSYQIPTFQAPKDLHLAQQISEEIHFELDSEYEQQRNQCVWE